MYLQNTNNQLLVFLLILPLSFAYYPIYEIEDCDYGNGNYTKNSHFHDNLKLLLSSLSRSTPTTGYFEDTQGSSNSPNKVFGHALCRGDLQLPQECRPCVEYAVDEIGKLCPFRKNAGVLYDECFLRYGSENFFGKPTGSKIYFNMKMNITNDQKQFFAVRETLLSKLLAKATDGTSTPPLFAAGGAVVSSEMSVFALLQCTRDLPTKDCYKCLQYLTDTVPLYCKFHVGSLRLGKSCFLRYQNRVFFNTPSAPPSLPPQLPPSIIPEAPKGRLLVTN